jgi:hypothetical protein
VDPTSSALIRSISPSISSIRLWAVLICRIPTVWSRQLGVGVGVVVGGMADPDSAVSGATGESPSPSETQHPADHDAIARRSPSAESG